VIVQLYKLHYRKLHISAYWRTCKNVGWLACKYFYSTTTKLKAVVIDFPFLSHSHDINKNNVDLQQASPNNFYKGPTTVSVIADDRDLDPHFVQNNAVQLFKPHRKRNYARGQAHFFPGPRPVF